MAFTLHMLDSFDIGTDPLTRWFSQSVTNIGPGGRGGSQRLMTGSGTSGAGSVVSHVLPAVGIRTVGFAFKLNGLSASTKVLARTSNSTFTQTEIRAVPSSGAGSTHNLQLFRSTTFIDTVATGITVDTWHHLCFKVEISSTAGQVIVLVNGAQTYSATSITHNSGTLNTERVTLMGLAQTEYDDFYTGGSTTTTAGDMLGDRRVATVVPAGAGDQTDLNVTGAANNWQAVTTHDGDSSFVWSRTPGDYDLYSLQPFSNPVLAVHAVVPFIVARKDDAGSRVLRLVTKSGSTTTEGSNIALSESYQFYPGDFLTQNPDTSSAWDQASLESLQIGPKVQS